MDPSGVNYEYPKLSGLSDNLTPDGQTSIYNHTDGITAISDRGYSASGQFEAERQGQREECRDFMRNACVKGDRCKFYHPPKPSHADILAKHQICHDFQNRKGCQRINCKFLHLSKSDEEYIKIHGYPPPDLPEAELNKIDGVQVPICKDFINGKCNRGSKCKFRHSDTERQGRGRSAPYSLPPRPLPDSLPSRVEMRHRYQQEMMEDEIVYLRAQVSRLKRQVADLSANNEALMSENAQLRIKRPRPVSPLQSVLDPASYSTLGSTLSAFSNSPRLLAADPYSSTARSAIAQNYAGISRPTAASSSLAFSTAYPRY